MRCHNPAPSGASHGHGVGHSLPPGVNFKLLSLIPYPEGRHVEFRGKNKENGEREAYGIFSFWDSHRGSESCAPADFTSAAMLYQDFCILHVQRALRDDVFAGIAFLKGRQNQSEINI